jgi:hypothetical protein
MRRSQALRTASEQPLDVPQVAAHGHLLAPVEPPVSASTGHDGRAWVRARAPEQADLATSP